MGVETMRKYKQLTAEERYCIYIGRKEGRSLRTIAKEIGRSHSTLSRETRRNKGLRGYRPKQANEQADKRQQAKPKFTKLDNELTKLIEDGLKQRWSPEQICGRLELEQGIKLHHETVYRFVLDDQRNGGELYTHLRHRNKPYRKRYASTDYRGKIPDRIDISERPDIVEGRVRVGDWEADLVIGKGHKGAIVTLAERRSRLYLALPIAHKTAALTSTAITALLSDFKDFVHTLTFDNGREFTSHQGISKTLDCLAFFARPYHSWERGLNENFNGLLRQYFPKAMALDTVTEEEVLKAVEEMNNRPRKCLGFRTPWEVFTDMTGMPQKKAA